MGKLIHLPKREDPQVLTGEGIPLDHYGADGDTFLDLNGLSDPLQPFQWVKFRGHWLPHHELPELGQLGIVIVLPRQEEG